MKAYSSKVFKALFIGCALGVSPLAAQESKTYREEFKVNPDVVVELSTTHADLEFETWDRNEVVVEATIALEGASPEDAGNYFERAGVEILGSKSLVKVSTGPGQSWNRDFSGAFDSGVFAGEFAERLGPIMEQFAIGLPEMSELPPMPPVPFRDFDYKAYEKDGERYLKEWKKDFEKEFDQEYRERFEAWSKEWEARAAAMKARMEARAEEHAKMRETLEKQREDMARQREQAQSQALQAREQARQAREEVRKNPFHSSPKEVAGKRFTVRKTIRIKMPKGARLKLDVRHGEVKLAGNTLNARATLSYARFIAADIEGRDTRIEARYSPVEVHRWKGGDLRADFSEKVTLDEVGQLNLTSNSSEVTIKQLLREASLQNRLGSLRIGAVGDNFRKLVVSVENGELAMPLPRGGYQVEVANNHSGIDYPDFITWAPESGQKPGIRKGFSQHKDSDRSIFIQAAYSDVNLRQ
ncbi:hypothetical protein [Robiginitalea marina]|uniref:Adhesin domain-containing protein n=1 Tax=Robiginitalea marina TaxID=2954105 RepID=A0ABT1AWL9_9FLAO|nr:hypothetical protein [Robiginitalea marina]MCO5724002.1 hypothetical protein [Robiginitalea marina]